MLDLSGFGFARFLCILICSSLVEKSQHASASPTLRGISDAVFSVGTKILVLDSAPRGIGSTNYTTPFSQAVSNPGLVLSLNKLSILMTNNAAVSSNKYLLAIVTALTSNSFSYKLQVFSSTTTLYSTILQYFVYNKLDPLIQALQISSLHVSLNTYNFYFGSNYHQETLTLTRFMLAPTRPRFYLPSAPTCIVYNLGHKIESTDATTSVSANCSVEFGTNQVLVTVSGNDNIVVDTYQLSLLVYVQPEGRYFGYFEDPLNYAYGSTSINRSQQYLWVSANNYDTYSVSKYSENVAHYVAQIVSAHSSIELIYGITGLAVRNIAQKYTFQFSPTLGTVAITNAEPSTQSITNPWIRGANTAHIFMLALMQCPNGYYYEKVSAMCFSSFSGGEKSCTGPQFAGRFGGNGVITMQMQGDGRWGSIYMSNGSWGEIRKTKYENNLLGAQLVSSYMDSSSSRPLILSEQYFIIDSVLYYSGIEKSQVPIISSATMPEPIDVSTNSSNATTSNQTNSSSNSIYAATIIELVDGRAEVARAFALESQQLDGTVFNISEYQVADTQVNSMKMIASINSDLSLSVGLLLTIESNPTNSTNSTLNYTNDTLALDPTGVQYEHGLVQLNNFEEIGWQMASMLGGNMSAADMIAGVAQRSAISDRIVLTTVNALTSIVELGHWQAYECTNSNKLQLVMDNYVWGLSVDTTFILYMGSPPANSTNLIHLTNSRSHFTYIEVTRSQCSIAYSQVLALPLTNLYNAGTTSNTTVAETYVVQVAVNKISYQDVPSFISMSQFNYLEAYYSQKYYQNRRLLVSCLLSSGEIYTFGSLNPFLHSHHHPDLNSTNSTINYTYAFDPYTSTLHTSNISLSYFASNSFNIYDPLYADGGAFSYAQIGVDLKMGSVVSSLISGIGDEGNSGLLNGSSTGAPTGQNIQILMKPGSSSVADMKTTSNGEYLFLLTNANLLYLLERQQTQTISPTTPPSALSNLTSFYTMKLLRLIDIYPQLQTAQSATTLMIDEVNGVVVVGTDLGNLYTIDCGWGLVLSPASGAIDNRDYLYQFVQLDIPVIPQLNTTNQTNTTNTTNDTNITNDTNSTNNTNDTNNANDTNNNTNNTSHNNSLNTTNTTNDSNTIPHPSPVPSAAEVPAEGIPQTTIIIVSVVCSVFGVASVIAIYFLFIKPAKVVKVNPELATRTNLYNTKSQFNDITQIGEKADTRTERINSGKTDAGSLMQFQNSSSNSVLNAHKNVKIKKTKDLIPQNSLHTLRSLDSPYGDENGRGLVQEKDRTIIVDFEQ